MSVEALSLVLHHAKVSGTEKVVLLGIANHDGDGGAWPTIATLAKYANVHPRNVQRAIESLVKAGLLKVYLQQGGTASVDDLLRPNLYQVLVSCPPECDGSKNHRTDRGGASAAPPPGASAAPPVAPAPPKPSLEPLSPSERDTRARAVPVTSWSGPDENLYNWAKEQGWTGSAVDFQAAAMRDWALSKAEKKVDWNAALRNWLRRQTPPPRPTSSGGAPIPSGWR